MFKWLCFVSDSGKNVEVRADHVVAVWDGPLDGSTYIQVSTGQAFVAQTPPAVVKDMLMELLNDV